MVKQCGKCDSWNTIICEVDFDEIFKCLDCGVQYIIKNKSLKIIGYYKGRCYTTEDPSDEVFKIMQTLEFLPLFRVDDDKVNNDFYALNSRDVL